MNDTPRSTPAFALKPGRLADDMKRASERVASGFSDWNEAIEAAAKALDGQHQGGHCGEGTGEIIVRQRRNAMFREAAEIVRSLKR